MKRKINFTLVLTALIACFAPASASHAVNERISLNISKVLTSTLAVEPDKSSTDYKMYVALKGENFDRTFLANMLVHHRGAVEMANLALTHASHREIKVLAKAILKAQSAEISQMTLWEKKWGYFGKSAPMSKDQGAMSMSGSNAEMMNALTRKNGVAFDKAFLIEMITHHQSAINMAAPGAKNAGRAEVKKLTVAIVIAQSREIKQMKQWQAHWGYKTSMSSNSMPGMSH